MRLFTAIELSEDARTAIAALQKTVAAALSDTPRSLRLVRTEHLHLTLIFIGEVPIERGHAIADVMSADIPQAPFAIEFGGIGVFPPSGPPRICWLGVLEGANEVVRLHAHVAGRLRGLDVAVEERPYRPHLTLGRWRDRERSVKSRIAPTAESVARMPVSAVTLFESRLSSSGPSYTRLASARLSCP
jgi:RNA 2',3'-cyclic 3'-phosphodiesterase